MRKLQKRRLARVLVRHFRWPSYIQYARLSRDDCNELTLFSAFDDEGNFALDQCEQGVIFTHAHVFARMHFRAALTNNDAASIDCLTTIDLDAESLRL